MCKLIMAVCTTIEEILYAKTCLGLFSDIFCCHGNGCNGLNMCAKFHCLMY